MPLLEGSTSFILVVLRPQQIRTLLNHGGGLVYALRVFAPVQSRLDAVAHRLFEEQLHRSPTADPSRKAEIPGVKGRKHFEILETLDDVGENYLLR